MDAPINHGGSDLRASSSDARRLAEFGLTKKGVELIVIRIFEEVIMPTVENMTKEDVELMVIHIFEEVIMSTVVRKIVREEVQSALQKLWPDKDRNNDQAVATSMEGRWLQLQFLDEVSIPVLTGGKLNGKGSADIRLGVYDKMTRQLVTSGPEASAKVEIFILQANRGEDELNWSIQDFDNKIIRGRNEGRPYFSKDMFVYLESGKGTLCDVKLGNGSTWVKDCWCRLGARVVNKFSGSMVQDTWTNSFMVRDSRTKYTKKKETPSLSDKVWRLRNIGKGGEIDQSLQRENIHTIEDLLIKLLKDSSGLKNIVNLRGKKWEDMVKNPRACASGRRMYCYTNSQENTSVVFNIHGEILYLYPKGQYAAAQMSSQKNKDVAGDLISSAVGHWEQVFEFDDESSLQQHLSRLQTYVDQPDPMEPGYSVRPQDIVTSEMIGLSSDTSWQGIIPNMISTQEKDMECIEPSFSIDDSLIMNDLDIGPVPCSNLDPETRFSNSMSDNFMNVDAGTGETGFMLAEPYRNREKAHTFDEASTSTLSAYSMGDVSSFDDCQHNAKMEPFSFPSPATDSLFFDMDPVPPPFWNDNIQFSLIPNDGTKWGWDVLVCVLALRFSLKRLVARKTRAQEISSYCC